MKTKEFDLVCVSFDGCFVKDSTHNSIEEAENASADLGSKWFFYPFPFILSGKKVVETGEGLICLRNNKAYMELMFKGRKFQTVINTFKKTFDLCQDEEADCYEFEHLMIETNRHLIR